MVDVEVGRRAWMGRGGDGSDAVGAGTGGNKDWSSLGEV